MYAALQLLPTEVIFDLIHSWGESAGTISVSLHMPTNGGDTKGLFRGAYMQSGSHVPVRPIENGQKCAW